jgi:hypothetical protein
MLQKLAQGDSRMTRMWGGPRGLPSPRIARRQSVFISTLPSLISMR